MNADYIITLRVLDQLPKTLRDIREEKKISQRKIADECGMSNATVSRVESGKAYDSDTAKKLIQWIDRNQE